MPSDVVLTNALERALAGNEDAALTVYNALSERFGWSGTVFTRGDVQSALDTMLEATGRALRALTEDEWEQVQATDEWAKGLPGQLTEHGWKFVRLALTSSRPTSRGSCFRC